MTGQNRPRWTTAMVRPSSICRVISTPVVRVAPSSIAAPASPPATAPITAITWPVFCGRSGWYLNAGVETRGRFIIDPDGVVQGYEVLTPPVGRNVMESFRQVQAFQLVRESKGKEATPSGWKPGKTTLKPGPDLVGRVWEVWKTEMEAD